MAPSTDASPDGVVDCIDLTDESPSQQQERLGDVRRSLSSIRKRKRKDKRASLKTTNADVIDLLDDSDDDAALAELMAVRSIKKKPKIEGQKSTVKQENKKPAARTTSLETDGFEVVPTSLRDRMVAAAAPSAMNDDDEVVLEGVYNELRLPHLRQDCRCSFKKVQMNSLLCPEDALQENEKCCDLCYCYVCDCAVKDCKKWRSQVSRSTNHNHCCAVNSGSLWQRLRQQEKTTNRALAAAAGGGAAPPAAAVAGGGSGNNLQAPPGYHFSYYCSQKSYYTGCCRECWCFVCDKEGGQCDDHWHHMSQGNPNSLRWQQERANRKSSTYGKSGPFPPDNTDAPQDPGLTKCRHCSWYSRLREYRSSKSDNWCHCCGRVASVVDLSKEQAPPLKEADLKEMYCFGEKEIPFRIHAHDPRQFNQFKLKWTANPGWQYDEANREEEVFLHLMGGSPKLYNITQRIACCPEDKIPKTGTNTSERDQTDAIVIDDPDHVNLINVLKSGNVDCLSTKASWNKQLRSGVLKIELWFPKSFILGNNRNSTYSEFQKALPSILSAWFACTFDLPDLSGRMQPLRKNIDVALKGMEKQTIALPFGSPRSVKAKAHLAAARQLVRSRKDELSAARDTYENNLSLISSEKRGGGTSPSETSFESCLLRYFQEHFPKFVEYTSQERRARELIGISAGQLRGEGTMYGSSIHDRTLDCIVGYADGVLAKALFSDVAHKYALSDSMTTKDIMARLENLGHASEAFVEGLNVELLDFQKQALKWALEREQTTGGIQSFYWAKLPGRDGGHQGDLYFNPVLGQFRMDKPKIVRGGILAQEMGLGKTIISLSLILKNPAPSLPKTGSEISTLQTAPAPAAGEGWDKSLYEKTSQNNKKRGSILSHGTLVVCPVSLVGQWIEEAKSRLKNPGLVYPYHGQSRKRDAKKLAEAAIVVTTYQTLASDDTYHRSKGGADYCPPVEQVRWWRIIADEGHSLREGSTNRNRACQTLVADHKWIVTGTPISNNPKEMKNLFKFIGVEESEKMFSSIGSASTGRRRRYSGESRHAELLMFLVRPLLLRHSQKQKYQGTGTTLMSLPPMTKRTIEVAFSAAEKNEFDKLEKAAQDFYLEFRRRHVKDMSKHFLKVNAKLQPMRIASAGGKYPISSPEPMGDSDDDSSDEEIGATVASKKKKAVQYSKFAFTSKAQALIDELKRIRDNEPESKSLVFSQFASTLDHLQEMLPQHGFSFRTLKGNMSMTQRAKALHDFQNDPPTTVFLLSMRSGAVGINLTQANRVFLMEPGFNPSLELQAIGRVHRLGQKRSVEICRLVMKDSFESRMVEFLKKKYGLAFDDAGEEKEDDAAPDGSEDDNADGDKKEDSKKKAKSSPAKPVAQLVGNLQREKAEVMTEEFDELFGVQDRVAKAEEEAAAVNQNSSSNHDDDDAIMPDPTLSGFV